MDGQRVGADYRMVGCSVGTALPWTNKRSAFTQKCDEDGRKIRSKRAGHQSYYYIFERLTSDAKAMKMIRLGYWQAKEVFRGARTVEDFAVKKERKRSQVFKKKVSYCFCD